MYTFKRNQGDIPIKIGGWDGKFVCEKPKLKDGYEYVKPTRGTLEKQQWQEGRKEIIQKGHENHESTSHSEQTTKTSSATSTESREHTIRVEQDDQNYHRKNYAQQQRYNSFNNEHLENQHSTENNNNVQYSEEHQNQSNYDEQQQVRKSFFFSF